MLKKRNHIATANALRVRKHREKLKAAQALTDNNINPAPIDEGLEPRSPDSDFAVALATVRNSWPRRLGQKNQSCPIRLQVLRASLKAITKLVKPRGLHYDWALPCVPVFKASSPARMKGTPRT